MPDFGLFRTTFDPLQRAYGQSQGWGANRSRAIARRSHYHLIITNLWAAG